MLPARVVLHMLAKELGPGHVRPHLTSVCCHTLLASGASHRRCCRTWTAAWRRRARRRWTRASGRWRSRSCWLRPRRAAWTLPWCGACWGHTGPPALLVSWDAAGPKLQLVLPSRLTHATPLCPIISAHRVPQSRRSCGSASSTRASGTEGRHAGALAALLRPPRAGSGGCCIARRRQVPLASMSCDA